MQTNPPDYFKALTGVRAVAAYMVFLHHYSPPLRGWPGGYLIISVVQEFHIGVTIFFTLSGFLITYRYQHRHLLKKADFRLYFSRRFARIFPTYFILTCLTFGYIFYCTGFTSENVKAFFLNVTLLRGFSEEFRFSGISQGWSLTVEETFYLSAPLLFYAVSRFHRRNYWLVLLLYTAVSLAAGMMLTKVIRGCFLDFLPNLEFLLVGTFFGRVFEFAFGAALAYFLVQRPAAITTGGAGGWCTYAGLAGIMAIAAGLAAIRTTFHVQYGISHPFGMLLNNLVLPCFIILLFYGLLHERSSASRLLAHPVLGLLGRSSYSFYLLHLGLLGDILTRWLAPDTLFHYCVLFGVILLASIVCYFLLEEPAVKFTRRLLQATPASVGSRLA